MAKKPPTVKRTRDIPLQVRITPEEHETYKRAAEADGRSLSNWVRERLNACAKMK
jgi:predicted HicB family RNase H-like nuclease